VSAWTLVWIGAATMGVLMGALWVVQLRTRNAGIVDVGWAGGLAVLALLYATLAGGAPARRLLVGLMGGVWGLRLAWHLAVHRVIGQPEEGRYQHLRRVWAHRLNLKFLAFFLLQGALDVLLSAPFLLAARDPRPSLSWIELAGAAIWAFALLGETAADRQLEAFKRDPSRRSGVCDVGLWRWSRHPNYFFEWLIWIGVALVALPSPFGWLGLASPALILYFLLRVTGIPATEAQALRSRGEAYRRYQQRTSPFVPWWPKRASR
jgi:steroid 5-alpha reductase family enzyme